MTTDDIYAAAEQAIIDRVERMTGLSVARSVIKRHSIKAEARAAVDAVAPLLIAQGRREAAAAIRALDTDSLPEDMFADADYWLEQAARYAEGGTP